ncbi:A24 family peptidase [Actinoplanes sp. TFC3]|uniref:prepilin peptidase n=1 Tax=Actinoplanes sp. TFC3 TaxID=1710355 RepID=UPI0008343FD3|nr:A24 family peptidase [Actinoplanes sp. TFC3]
MSLPLIVGAAVFGGASAAFVPRIAHRLAVPRGTPARTACAHCAKPMLDWVRAGAPCSCSRQPLWTVGAAALVASLLGAVLGESLLLLIVLPASVLAVLLAAVDMRCQRLPDPLVAALALITAVPLGAGAVLAGEPARLLRAVAAAGVCFSAYLMIALIGRGLGLGDVKLAAVLGFVLGYAGWPAVLAGLIVPHLINGPLAVVLLVTRRAHRRSTLPLGPALLTGALVGLVVG